MTTEFRILGPLEVLIDGAPVAIGGPRQRALLAMLLLSANRVVSRDRLIDELLDGASADRSDHMLRVRVSRLRTALSARGTDDTRILAQAPGYLLRVEPGELDLQSFEGLLAEGHQALEDEDFGHASTTLREAESLWRGRPLADLEFERFARIDIERLQELRLVASEERTDAELALGEHSMLVPELEARVAEHPLRERSRAQLMLALYRCGRHADALASYRTGRALLSDELALEPGPVLRKLEQSILRQEPELDLPELAAAGVATAVAAPPEPPPPDGSPARRAEPTSQGKRKPAALIVGVISALGAVAVAVVVLAGGQGHRLTAAPDSIGMVDPRTGALEAVLPGAGPGGGIADGLGAVWETDTANDLLLEVDPRTRSVERIPVGRGPTGVAVGDGEVWVANQLDRTVSEINPKALKRVAAFPVGNGASSLAWGDGSLWVANVTDDTVTRVDPGTGSVSTIPLAGQPGGIAVGDQGVWVASESTGQLLLIDPGSNRVTQAVEIGDQPAGVVVGAGSVWVANTTDRTVSRFDPGSGTVTKVNVGSGPVGVTYGAGSVWVADSLDGTVARITPSDNAARLIHVGGAPSAITSGFGRLWTAVLPGPAGHVGGTLRVSEGGQYQTSGASLDPAQFAGLPQWQILSLTNDGLVTYRRVGGLAGSTLVPDLATSLPVPTDGGRTYTFHMRTGIHYSDGALVRPQDIRHEFERIFRLSNGYAESFYTGIVGAGACARAPQRCTLARGIVADDAASTVTFHLLSPDPDFPYKLAFPWADALPAATTYHDLGYAMPPATGPYVTRSISKSHRPGPPGHGAITFHTWVLVRNRDFHPWNPQAQPRGYPDRIELTDDQPSEQAAASVAGHGLDVLFPVPTSRLRQFALHYAQRFHSEPLGGTFAPVMNTRVAPFDHLAVRRALSYAIDRNRIVRLAGGPLAAQPTCQILPPTISGYQPYCPYTRDAGPSGGWHAPDMALARRLVAASGTRGMKVTMLVQPPDATNPTIGIGTYVVSTLRRLGYRAALRVVNDLYPTVDNSDTRTQIAWSNWLQDYPGPSDFINLLRCRAFHPSDPGNLNGAEFCDPKIDGAIREAGELQLSAPGAASQAWSRIDRRISDQAPWLPLYNPRLDVATSSRVGNYQYHPFWGLLLDQLWVR